MAELDYAEMGRIVAERKAIKDRVALLNKQLNDTGTVLGQLGSALMRNAEHVVFEGQSVTFNYLSSKSPHFKISDDLILSVKEAVQQLREEVDKLRRIEVQAQPYGV
jgi:hypothetical protein